MNASAHGLVLDTSAIMSILKQEDDAHLMARAIASANTAYISTVTQLEAFTVAMSRGNVGAHKLAEFLEQLMPQIVAFDNIQSQLSIDAMKTFGKGHHPANLNFGDCCVYALAKSLNLPLLYKGNDFSQTDLASALV